VTDNGHGIATADLPNVFDPFFTNKPVGKGMGLGLSITEAIIRDHGGTITVANRPNGGAMFTIRMPDEV
jgi:C4-dicarboxylate-specific signal transduction histidine kinase